MCVVVCERAHESESVCWQWWMSSTSEQSASAAPQRNHESLQETCLWRGPPLSDVLSERFVFGAGERCTIFPYCIGGGPCIPVCGWRLQALTRFLHSTKGDLTLFKSQHTVLGFRCFVRVCSCESSQAPSWRATNRALKPRQ